MDERTELMNELDKIEEQIYLAEMEAPEMDLSFFYNEKERLEKRIKELS